MSYGLSKEAESVYKVLMGFAKGLRSAGVEVSEDLDAHSWLTDEFELYESEACNFEVLDNGVWYKIDAEHPDPELYEEHGVPTEIVERADRAIDELGTVLGMREDPTPRYLEALRREFDDARFVNMTLMPGIVY